MKRIHGIIIILLMLLFPFHTTPVSLCGYAKTISQASHFDYINVEGVHEETTGAGVVVAVIDTGIDTDHPAFQGKISEFSYNATENKIVKDYIKESGEYDWSLIEDEYGHGTAVSGLIASDMVGVAPDAKLMIIKVELNETGEYEVSELCAGIRHAVEYGADVINMSFGIYREADPFKEAIDLAKEAEVLCVAAAGNDASTKPCYPAANENVIAVGALIKDSWDLADYSNYGVNADMVAPGYVFTTTMGKVYGNRTGTSYTSPIVAGAAALYLAKFPTASCEEVQNALFSSSKDLGDAGKDDYFGYGALDVKNLLIEKKEENQESEIPAQSSMTQSDQENSDAVSAGCFGTLNSGVGLLLLVFMNYIHVFKRKDKI